MKLYIAPSFLIACSIGCVFSETLQEAIIKDIMPGKSLLCSPAPGSTSSDFTFTSSQEESEWFDGYEESFEKYNAPWSQLEKYVFNAKMMHTDVNSNRTWTVRLGKGGNVYSMVGPMGETVPPQKRIDSPWIDEVWHSVAVEPPQPEEPFMIHGAGSYQSDQTYNSDVGIPLTEVPFYSPSLGKYCNDADGECGFAAWAQHGPVPVYWESTALNFNRYVDCGDGIIEHTTVSHNNMGSDKNLMRLDAPFGSVRFSTLRDVVISDKNSEILIEPHDLGRFDNAATKVPVADTMGYTVFAEDLPSPLTGPYPLKSGVQFKIHYVGCRNAPDYYSGYKAVMCRLEPTEPDPSSTRVAVTFRGTPAPFSPLCDERNPEKCIDSIKFKKYNTGNFCRPFGNAGAVMCRLDNEFLDNFLKQSGTSSKIKFETESGKVFTASSGIMYWSFGSNSVYSMIFTPKSGVDTALNDIESMISDDPNEEWAVAFVNPPEAGGDITAKNGVINWVQYFEQTGAYWLFFNADEVPGVSDIGSHVAKVFPPGSTLEVFYNTGKAEEDNLALAHVYGNSYTDTRGQPTKGLVDGYPLLQVGNANEGKKPRDANVYNIVTTATKNTQGGSHYFRQYFIMDRYSDISARAASLVSEVKQQNYNVNDAGDETPIGRTVNLYKKGNIVGAAIGDEFCYGVENPIENPVENPFVYPTDNNGERIILQSGGRVGRAGHTDRLEKCVLNIALQKGLTNKIKGGPKDKKLVLKFYTEDGISTGEDFLVDGIRHWYWKARRMLLYPSAPYNTVESCSDAATVLMAMIPTYTYINVTYAEDTYAEGTEMAETSKVCVGSTTPNKMSKALFEVKCGESTYIGSDPYHFAPDGFTEDDNKKRPYICKNDSTARGTWKLLGFFPDGDCSLIQEEHAFDKAMCALSQSV